MIAKRLSVKFFVKNPQAVDLPKLMPVFQGWIQQHTVEGMLIDVVDYKHVPEGPGLILIAHEGDYSLDMAEGQPGVQYTYKQIEEENLAGAFVIAIQRALKASKALANDERVDIEVDVNRVQIDLLDRLRFPNDPQTWEVVNVAAEKLAKQLYGDAEVRWLERHARQPFAFQIETQGNFQLQDVLVKVAVDSVVTE